MLPTKISQVLFKVSGFQKRHISRELNRHHFNVNPPGSGAGRGAGGGGTIRESGVLGQYGAAHEEEYFFNKRKEQLEKIKTQLKKEPKSPEIKRKEDK